MRIRQLVLAALFTALPITSFAQAANPLTANVKIQLGALTGFVIRSAEKVPEDLYSFRATPEVRSMGQLYGHIADALFSMCSTAAGTKPPRTGIEKSVTAKPALIAALKEGVSYCNTVIDGMTDQKGTETVPFVFRSHAPVVGAVFRRQPHLRALRQSRDLHAAEEHRAAIQRTEADAVAGRRNRGCAPTS